MSDPAPRKAAAQQLVFDDLDTPLYDTTFVVVDLETTGTSPGADAITEIGAVKVRGGEVLGEFATLVNPGRAVPPAIVQVTGITTAMVYAAPKIDAVLPGFLEFAAGAVLVAHNARFDTAFLRAAAASCETAWPSFTVLCTVKLARRVLGRDEAPSVRLSALAQLLGASTQPTHRALDDARATVDVLHALIGRVGNQGVHSLTELVDYLPDVTPRQRAKRFLAADLPTSPGVYLFRGPSDEVLYIGTAVNLRRRVRSYFTGSETRGRMKEMVSLATRVDHVVCAHALEAGVRELRLLVAHTPPYNRRSKFPKRAWWITLTAEPFPRFAIARTPNRDALGPFNSRNEAAELAVIIAEHTGLRTCTTRLPSRGRHECPPAIVGGCPAAGDGRPINTEEYAPVAARVRALFAGHSDAALRTMLDRIESHSRAEHFEAAARLRDRTVAVIRALHRTQRLTAVARIAELIAAHPDGVGGWEFAVIRYGRLAAAGTAVRGVSPMPVVERLVAAAETVIPEGGAHPIDEASADAHIDKAPNDARDSMSMRSGGSHVHAVDKANPDAYAGESDSSARAGEDGRRAIDKATADAHTDKASNDVRTDERGSMSMRPDERHVRAVDGSLSDADAGERDSESRRAGEGGLRAKGEASADLRRDTASTDAHINKASNGRRAGKGGSANMRAGEWDLRIDKASVDVHIDKAPRDQGVGGSANVRAGEWDLRTDNASPDVRVGDGGSGDVHAGDGNAAGMGAGEGDSASAGAAVGGAQVMDKARPTVRAGMGDSVSARVGEGGSSIDEASVDVHIDKAPRDQRAGEGGSANVRAGEGGSYIDEASAGVHIDKAPRDEGAGDGGAANVRAREDGSHIDKASVGVRVGQDVLVDVPVRVDVGAWEDVPINVPPLRGASPEEAGLVVRWLARPGVRIVRTSEGYREPVYGAARWSGWAEVADAAARTQPAEEEYVNRLG
ncbi:DEDD exonuclease domain-containing protein [Nocardia sp. NPDC049149]|uniref:DEDD exonuclease domain-containing protein n=1 Tax=Nocardia sp. NPDC049149 TaxID=3364315 RepID=UPI003718211D